MVEFGLRSLDDGHEKLYAVVRQERGLGVHTEWHAARVVILALSFSSLVHVGILLRILLNYWEVLRCYQFLS
jgi:hypothetical protein